MTFGVHFNNNGLFRVLDGERIVPQLIAIYNMANYTHFDLTEADGTHPGWIQRIYQFNWDALVFNRPVIVFMTLPNQGYDVYASGYSVMYKTGQPFSDPIWYVFALDYVTPSGQSIGLKIWKPGSGELMYDSANFHLNIRALLNVTVDTTIPTDRWTEYPTGAVRTFSGTFPSNGAYVLPRFDIFREYATRFTGFGTWNAFPHCRIRGSVVDILMLRTGHEVTLDDTYNGGNSGYDHIYKGNGDNLIMMAIDADMYN